jgi:hypothetical protein
MSITGWKFCRALSATERMEIYEYRRGAANEELFKKQAEGVKIKHKWLERLRQIPRHRALVIVPQGPKITLKVVIK